MSTVILLGIGLYLLVIVLPAFWVAMGSGE